MNVIFDTNIIISAGLTPKGVSAKVFETVINSGKMKLYYSSEIFEEYEEVLSRPYLKIPCDIQTLFLEAIKCFGVLITPIASNIPMSDESDRKFYDAANECGAVLITGNKKHYPIEETIINPADFLKKHQEY